MSRQGFAKTQGGGFPKNVDSRPGSLTADNHERAHSKEAKSKRKAQERKFDPANPFTYWLKGTDACNEMFEKEQQLKRQKIKSAGSDGRRLPYYDRLSKPAGLNTREGFFRKLKNELEDVRFTNPKVDVIRNNLVRFEEQLEDKPKEIDFNELIFKAKRIPIKKYIEYKREIRLSKLKQVDIEANINDMRNLIVKADEELEENVGTEKKSMDEVNASLQYSREVLERVKAFKFEKNKALNEHLKQLNVMKNNISHLDNAIRELRSKIMLMEMNREFLIRISGFEDDSKRAIIDKFDREQIRKGEFGDYPTHDLENEDETMTLLTAIGRTSFMTAMQGFDTLSALERNNPLLLDLRSPADLVDRLRRIESDNLEIIQMSQNTIEEINHTNGEIGKIQEYRNKNVSELSENIKKLEEVRSGLEATIKLKQEMIDQAKYNKLQVDNSSTTLPKTQKDSAVRHALDLDENPMTVEELIFDIFTKYSSEDIFEEYKGGAILQQLLCIERSLKYFESFKNELVNKNSYFKMINKTHSNNKEQHINSFKLERMRREKEREDQRKLEKEEKLRQQAHTKKTRPDMAKSFNPKKEIEVKQDKVDANSEYQKNLKYFT